MSSNLTRRLSSFIIRTDDVTQLNCQNNVTHRPKFPTILSRRRAQPITRRSEPQHDHATTASSATTTIHMFASPFTASRTQVVTYLFGVALFSISFLVFLNSSVSFVITDLIGYKHPVGNAVGTLGFADELLALVACPFWGLLSDRVGVRTVSQQLSGLDVASIFNSCLFCWV